MKYKNKYTGTVQTTVLLNRGIDRLNAELKATQEQYESADRGTRNRVTVKFDVSIGDLHNFWNKVGSR